MEKIKLGSEVWEKVFASPLYQEIVILVKEIFRRNIRFGDFGTMGIRREEWGRLRGPREVIPVPLCELILETDEGLRQCSEKEKQSTAKVSSTLKPNISTCHGGLTDMVIPIVVQGQYCGYVNIRGGLLCHKPDETKWQEIAERVKHTGVDLKRLEKAYFEMSPTSNELLEVMVKLLNVIVKEIARVAIEVEDSTKRISE
jgi:ligand-binding sensor protein